MKCIVVNGDDLGASPGVNRGMAEVHRRGPLTSAGLMVNMPASQEGARLARDLPGLSVGLHSSTSVRPWISSPGTSPLARPRRE
jgi:chitin disaccharide deacetylase